MAREEVMLVKPSGDPGSLDEPHLPGLCFCHIVGGICCYTYTFKSSWQKQLALCGGILSSGAGTCGVSVPASQVLAQLLKILETSCCCSVLWRDWASAIMRSSKV